MVEAEEVVGKPGSAGTTWAQRITNGLPLPSFSVALPQGPYAPPLGNGIVEAIIYIIQDFLKMI